MLSLTDRFLGYWNEIPYFVLVYVFQSDVSIVDLNGHILAYLAYAAYPPSTTTMATNDQMIDFILPDFAGITGAGVGANCGVWSIEFSIHL